MSEGVVAGDGTGPGEAGRPGMEANLIEVLGPLSLLKLICD